MTVVPEFQPQTVVQRVLAGAQQAEVVQQQPAAARGARHALQCALLFGRRTVGARFGRMRQKE